MKLSTFVDGSRSSDAGDRERRSCAPHDVSPVALVGSGSDGVITSWNRAATQVLGWTADEVIGRRLVDVLGCDVTPRSGNTSVSRVRAQVTSARGEALDVHLLVDGESCAVDPQSDHVVAVVPVDAIARGTISVRFQPVVELCTGRILQFEALARWHSTEFGDVDPNSYIEAADDPGLGHDLGRLVLDHSLDVVQAEHLAGRWGTLRMSVNVSATQLAHPDFSTRVVQALSTRRLGGDVLQLELTDTRRALEMRLAAQHLNTLRRAGVRIALDDFGAGAAMSYLRDLPVEVLKIDRRFIAGMCTSSIDTAVIRSIISLATELQLETIAEGVDSEDQHRDLSRMGCFAGQGLLYARDRDQDELYTAVGPPPQGVGRHRSAPPP
jgi:EAL domain-containing protein (putative c-di-GMP-specific phosphodiesterase class I)